MIKATFLYKLRPGEAAETAAARFSSPPGHVASRGGPFIELPVEVDGDVPSDAHWQSVGGALEEALATLLPSASRRATVANGVPSIEVKRPEETFDITLRGNKLFITNANGEGGVDVLEQGSSSGTASLVKDCFERGYEAYRVQLLLRNQ